MKKPTPRSALYSDQIINVPNALTVLRLLLIPALYVSLSCYDQGKSIKLLSSFIFTVAMITDFLDGLIARKTNQTTLLGKILDPMADKLVITTALVLMLQAQIIPAWIVIVLLSRELVINTLKTIASQHSIHLSSSWTGKAKTFAQSYGIGFTILGPFALFGVNALQANAFGMLNLYLAVFTSLYSAAEYFCIFFKKLQKTT